MTPFNKSKYIEMQSKKILEHVGRFSRVYLEFGGKMFNEFHGSRVFPGFDLDTKVEMLGTIRDRCEVILTILAEDIERSRYRPDVGLTYEDELLVLVEKFKKFGIHVNSVVVNKYAGQVSVDAYKQRLESLGISVHIFNKIEGYTTNIDRVLSPEGYGSNPFIKTTKDIVIITAPGAGSGKMAVALSQLYNEMQQGNKNVGFAKFETFPVWNLPLNHPVNIAYEAATINVGDFNVIDNFHFEKYGEVAISYNRDIQSFPLLQTMLRRMYGEDVYHSPTDMGVNMAKFAIEDEEAVLKSARMEILRRYLVARVDYKKGRINQKALDRITGLFAQVELDVNERSVLVAATQRKEKTGKESGSIELLTGEVISTSGSEKLSTSCKLLLKTLQTLIGVNTKIKVLSDAILEKVQELKKNMGEQGAQIMLDDVLLILASSSLSNELAHHAMQKISAIKGAEIHITTIIGEDELRAWRKLGVNLTMHA